MMVKSVFGNRPFKVRGSASRYDFADRSAGEWREVAQLSVAADPGEMEEDIGETS